MSAGRHNWKDVVVLLHRRGPTHGPTLEYLLGYSDWGVWGVLNGLRHRGLVENRRGKPFEPWRLTPEGRRVARRLVEKQRAELIAAIVEASG